jgi:hypothetical protein
MKIGMFTLIIIIIAGCESSPLDTNLRGTITISYSVPSNGHVRIDIVNQYDVIEGTIVDEIKPPGSYSVVLNPSLKLEEGVFFILYYFEGQLQYEGRMHLGGS